jgi:hypothetical protein
MKYNSVTRVTELKDSEHGIERKKTPNSNGTESTAWTVTI